MFPINLDVGDVVLKDGGHIHFRELVLAEDDQQARLPARAVANDHELLPDGRHIDRAGGGTVAAASVTLKKGTEYRDVARRETGQPSNQVINTSASR